jgi:hypothetical protein
VLWGELLAPSLGPPVGKQRQEVATSALCECGSGAPRRRALRGPCLCSNPPGKKKKEAGSDFRRPKSMACAFCPPAGTSPQRDVPRRKRPFPLPPSRGTEAVRRLDSAALSLVQLRWIQRIHVVDGIQGQKVTAATGASQNKSVSVAQLPLAVILMLSAHRRPVWFRCMGLGSGGRLRASTTCNL